MIFELLAWGLVALLGLSFFGISVPGIIDSPAGQENFAFIAHLFEVGWNWIKALIESLWSLLP
jgi:hypothetical protein